jgi:DNA replication protein DnaC
MRQQLVVTTNCSGRELRDRLGDRVVSRLVEMCVPVKMVGGDYRLGQGGVS